MGATGITGFTGIFSYLLQIFFFLIATLQLETSEKVQA
jgi:hypothetical protein